MATAARRLRTAAAGARGATPPPTPPRRPGTAERGRAHITSAYSQSKVVIDETEKEEEVSLTVFAPGEEPAHVRVGAGLTINMGNFESLRLDCSVSLPCRPDDIEETYEIAAQFVADKINEEQARWTGAPTKGSGR